MQTALLTTRIDRGILESIRKSAHDTGTTQRAIIEQAMQSFLRQKKKQRIQESSARLAHDIEMVALSEQGMSDYALSLSRDE